ncbi:MAG: phosphohistidine phosphatase SixA [Polyangiaceae bacterium]
MKLYVMRHGPAEDVASSGRDSDRALTPSGRERVRVVAKALLDGDEAPMSIVSSPYVRALQTAEIVAGVTNLAERGGTVVTRRELESGRSVETQNAFVTELLLAKKKRVMVVGHEPDLSLLVAQLVGHAPALGMQKAMVVGLQLRDGVPTKLRFVLHPTSLQWDRADD